MNLFARFKAWLEWRRRERERIPVATATFTTEWHAGGVSAGIFDHHIITYFKNGNGARLSTVETTGRSACRTHRGVIESRSLWRVHGTLPSFAVRVTPPRGGASLRVIDGGAA